MHVACLFCDQGPPVGEAGVLQVKRWEGLAGGFPQVRLSGGPPPLPGEPAQAGGSGGAGASPSRLRATHISSESGLGHRPGGFPARRGCHLRLCWDSCSGAGRNPVCHHADPG